MGRFGEFFGRSPEIKKAEPKNVSLDKQQDDLIAERDAWLQKQGEDPNQERNDDDYNEARLKVVGIKEAYRREGKSSYKMYDDEQYIEAMGNLKRIEEKKEKERDQRSNEHRDMLKQKEQGIREQRNIIERI